MPILVTGGAGFIGSHFIEMLLAEPDEDILGMVVQALFMKAQVNLNLGETEAIDDDLKRILATDPDQVMPPPHAKKTLSPHQKELLARWIEQGAKWQKHWSQIAPVRPPVPEVDAKLKPHSLSLPQTRVGLNVQMQSHRRQVRNVIGYLEGSDYEPGSVFNAGQMG